MTPAERFFLRPENAAHRRYEALRAFHVEGKKAEEVSGLFGYTVSTVYTLVRNFKKLLDSDHPDAPFFVSTRPGRREKDTTGTLNKLIVELRKKYLSVPEIKTILDSLDDGNVSEKYVYNILKKEGFARLPRRSHLAKDETHAAIKIEAAKSELLEYTPEVFQTERSIGLLCLLPHIQELGIDRLIEQSQYPETKSIPKLNAVLSFLALKLSNVRRYTADDLWCMDRGLGFFAGLNVLPKAAWFTSYSHRVTRKANLEFLKRLSRLWAEQGYLSDTANLDFTTIPYWGDDAQLENNWSGTRHKALASILAVLAHDPDTGIITYGDTSVRHNSKSEVALEFLDFYSQSGGQELRYLVFDSKFTTYENLAKLDDDGTKFITIRRRGKKTVDRLVTIPDSEKKKIRVPASNGKKRLLTVVDEAVFLKNYGDDIRQVSISGHGKIKPAIIITNDFDLPVEAVVRKYARRWIIEKTISEQIEFFHLNKLSSSMVIKVDFDLTMTILAHNLYRVFAQELDGYSHSTADTLYRKFMCNGGDIQVTEYSVIIDMKKKRLLPAILTAMDRFQNTQVPWMRNKSIVFRGASRT